MKNILTTAINGYEQVIKGEKSGRDYLLEFMNFYEVNDDEIIYMLHAAADVVQNRPKENIKQNCHQKQREFPIVS